MCWFAITPVLGGELLKSERFWASSYDSGTGRAVGRLDERFEAKGQAYAAVGVTYRVDELGPNAETLPALSEDTLLGIITPEADADGRFRAVWEAA